MNVNDISIVLKLLGAYARQHVGRTLLTLLSTVAAASIVVWVVSSYDSLVEKFDDFADKYLGRYSLIVLPMPAEGQTGGPFGPSLTLNDDIVAALRKDPNVAVVDAVFQSRLSVTNPNAPPEPRPAAKTPAKTEEKGKADPNAETPPPTSQAAMNTAMRSRGNRTPTLVGTDAIEPPYEMTAGKWLNPKDKEALQAVITSASAESLKLKVGDDVEVGGTFGRGEQMTLKIIGVVEQRQSPPQGGIIIGLPSSTMNARPLARGPASAALYVPVVLAERISGSKAAASYAGVVLKPSANLAAFQQTWTDKFAAEKANAELQTLADVETELEGSTTSEHVRAQAWSATGISLLASLFIIFTTLSMGVDERIRQFAVLRAVACTKSQIALLIMLEGLLLGLLGWAGGLLAGWALLQFMLNVEFINWLSTITWLKYFDFLPADPRTQIPGAASLGNWCIILSGICALGGSLAASILPAWKATRVKPLDALAPSNRMQTIGFPWLATICGLGLIAINPLLVFFVPMPDTSRYLISALFGCTAMAIGFVLLAPVAILVTERTLGPVLARLLGLNPQLLALQLSSNFWRTLGTAVALTLGLGLYVSMQVWGYSMLNPYMPGEWFPDMVAGLTPGGVPDSEFDAIRNVPGIKQNEVVPIANQQVKFVEDVTNAKAFATSSRQDNCVLMGVDPELAFGGDKPLFNFDYAAGTRADVIKKFKSGGRYCLVPDHFEREANLHVGDKFAVRLPASPEEQVEYEIAGVVNMNGWHWMSKGGLRNNGGGRSAGLMFAPIQTVRKDFDIKQVSFFWFNLDGTKTEEEVKDALQVIAQTHYKPTPGRGGRSRGGPSAGGAPGGQNPGTNLAAAAAPGGFGRRGGGGPNVQFRTVASVRAAMNERAVGIFKILSRLPLVTLFVTSLGMINTVLASIRARRWDMGIMRSIGVTRFQLFRLIVAEALLIGIVACMLSLAFGAMAGYCGVGVTRYVNVRGGQVTHLVIPWIPILWGFAITLTLCLIASVWPAIRTARTETLSLLQQGRTAI